MKLPIRGLVNSSEGSGSGRSAPHTPIRLIHKEMMMKIYTELDLSRYSKTELIELFKLNILTRYEIKLELLSRGMSEWAVVSMIRAA